MPDQYRSESGQQQTGAGAVQAAAESAAGAVREKAQRVKEVAAHKLEQGWEHVKSWEQSLEGQIERHPMRSVLIAAGVGFAVGLLCRGRW
jgi:ElaB/YqjD/DUF883 family membrane-anchored ribosome-binding protein